MTIDTTPRELLDRQRGELLAALNDIEGDVRDAERVASRARDRLAAARASLAALDARLRVLDAGGIPIN